MEDKGDAVIMSNFICEFCGAEIIDSDNGYITGCEHYPVEDPQKKHGGGYGGYRRFYEALEAGDKYDNGKLKYALLPHDAIAAIVDVLSFGADKYQPRNWEKGIEYSRVYNALLRHIFAWWQGEDIDPESGKPHLAHAGCCLLFLLAYEQRGMERFDDRYEAKTRKTGGKDCDGSCTRADQAVK